MRRSLRFSHVSLLAVLLAPAPTFAQSASSAPPLDAAVRGNSSLVLSSTDHDPSLLTQQPTPQAPPPATERRRRRPSMVGYIEDASVASQVRVRFDIATGNAVPDRAEFFYAKCGCYQIEPPPGFDPEAPGPGPGIPTELDFQQFYVLGELAVRDRTSFFAELPFRAIQPQGFLDLPPQYAPFPDASGISDIRFGAKLSLAADDRRDVTLQVRASAPSGDPGKGLSTNSWSVEPAFLMRQNLGERVGIEGQAGVWLPLGGSAGVGNPDDDFSGDVLFYGIGPSFHLVTTDRFSFSPVVELVGWRVLSGYQTKCGPGGCEFDAEGVNIVNMKVGARASVERNSFYAGFGWSLTDEHWYDTIFRLEYRYGF
jgi:hypothetical protein